MAYLYPTVTLRDVLSNHMLTWQQAAIATDDEIRRAVNKMASGDFVAEDTLAGLLRRRQIVRALVNELTEIAGAGKPE
jgi:hypothetical protein